MLPSAARLDVGAELRPDLDALPDLTEQAAIRLGADEIAAERIGRSIAAACARFTRERAPWIAARVSLSLLWPVLTVSLQCADVDYVEYIDVSGILGVGAGAPVAACEVSR